MVTLPNVPQSASAARSPAHEGDRTLAARLAPDARMQALYDAHAKALYRFVLRLAYGERSTAEDLLQETLLRAWRNLDDLAADIDTLRPWLYTVARRIAIDAARARQARPAEVGVSDMRTLPDQSDDIERLLAVQTVRRALAALSPEHRSVIIEVYFRGRSASEAASVLGIPEGTVKSRTYYAVRYLRTVIGAPDAG